jgi:aquaporin Z
MGSPDVRKVQVRGTVWQMPSWGRNRAAAPAVACASLTDAVLNCIRPSPTASWPPPKLSFDTHPRGFNPILTPPSRPTHPPSPETLPTPPILQALLCEFVGTFFLVLAIVLAGGRSSVPGASDHAYMAIGLTIAAMIYAFDHIGGANFNPAVTLAFVVTRRMNLRTAFSYVIAQILGGLAGALMGYAIAGTASVQPFTPAASVSNPTAAAFGVEALYTFALILVQQNAAAEKNQREPNSYFGLAVSFTVLAGAKAVGPISGGCFNPAVGTALDFASLLITDGNFNYIWIYWAAPLLGAVAGALVKVYMNLPSHQEVETLPLVVPVTEFIGTFFLVLTASLTGDGLAVGAMLLALVYMGDHVCGADYNPAVTLGVALRMGVPLREYWKVIVTIIAQFAGGLVGAAAAYGLAGSVSYPNPDGTHGIGGAVMFETLWTSLLVYVVCAVMTPTQAEDDPEVGEERKGHSRSFQGLAIGFVVAGGIYSAGKNGGGSGGVFNPAVGTGIAVVDFGFTGSEATISNLWVYWLAPFLGSIIGSGLFTLLHYHKDPALTDFSDELGDAAYM